MRRLEGQDDAVQVGRGAAAASVVQEVLLVWQRD